MNTLSLGGCNLQGSIPVNDTGHSIFSSLVELKEFHVEAAGEGALCNTRNGLSGKLPADLKDAKNLEVLGLYCNIFTGTLLALAALTQLKQVDAHFNLFTGPLPSLIKSKASLVYLSVANNQLTGTIPANYSQMKQLTTFGVAFNQLEGPLDAIVNALPNLTV
jgi:hypothetical protein